MRSTEPSWRRAERRRMLYGALDSEKAEIAAEIAECHIAREPELWKRYGEAGVQRCKEDASYLLSFLSEALRASDAGLFVAYLRWAAVLLESRNIGREHLLTNLRLAAPLVARRLSDGEATKAADFLQAGIDALTQGEISAQPSHLDGDAPIDELARTYLAALLRMDRSSAYSLVIRALDEGVSIRDLYLGVFERVQYEIGRLWQTNAISVGQEHYCTAATQSIIARLYDYLTVAAPCNKCVVAICVSGELHEIGLRIVCDFLEMEGWSSIYVGANTPAADIIRLIVREKADVLAISATMTFHVQRVREIIDAVRKSMLPVKIIVGGLPFRMSPDLWKNIGADGFARNAAELPDLMSRLGA